MRFGRAKMARLSQEQTMQVLSSFALDRATHKKSQPGRCEIA
jgi:hypothetical protein